MILIVTLLGVSLMFVAAMTSLSTNSQQELATIHKLVGTTITVSYADSRAGTTAPAQTSDSGSGSQPVNPGSGSPQLSYFSPTPIPDNVVTQARHVPGVISMQVSLARPDQDGDVQGGTITSPDGQTINAPVMVNGIDPDSATFTIAGEANPALVAGRSFRPSDTNADIAMMSQDAAQINHLSVGSTFTLKGTTFTLIGVYTASSQPGNSSVVIPVAMMEKLFQTHGVDSLAVTATSYEQVETVAARLRALLGPKYAVTTQTNHYSSVFSALQAAQQSLQIARTVSLVIAAIVTIFAVFQLVRERTAEIAINKAIGSSHLQVLRQFWTEIVILSATAAVLAVLLLVILGPFVAQRFDVDPASLVQSNTGSPHSGAVAVPGQREMLSARALTSVPNPLSNVHLAAPTLNPQTLLIIVGVGIGLALLASLIPIWSVSTIKPAQVLRAA
jgi:ABC-type antimicrobial peptide transport system permease subunit